MQKYVIALYIRLSIEDYKYDSMSIENQRMALYEFAYSMPESINTEILEFIDNGYSGTNFERPKIQELIEMVRENKIDCIIVKDFSRFGRNSIETGYFIERVFPLFHTRFISINDNFDSNNHKGNTGGMDIALKYLISEYYSHDMSVKTKSAKYAKMQRGEYQSKICPYGYRKSSNGRMEPDPEAAAVVKFIFQLGSTGMSAETITKELFKKGIITPSEYKAKKGYKIYNISRTPRHWTPQKIREILYDERYIGSYVIGKREVTQIGSKKTRLKERDKWFIIPNHHQPIIDKELFDKTQSVQRRFSLPNKKIRNYPLKVKIYCGCCDHALSRTIRKNTFYMCRHSFPNENSRCYNLRIDAAELEQAVFQTVKKQLEVALPMDSNNEIQLYKSSITQYEKQLEYLQNSKQTLFEQYILNKITIDDYHSSKAIYDAEICKIKNICNTVIEQVKLSQKNLLKHEFCKKITQLVSNSNGLTPELIELFIHKVSVFPDHRIEIAYKVQDIFEL